MALVAMASGLIIDGGAAYVLLLITTFICWLGPTAYGLVVRFGACRPCCWAASAHRLDLDLWLRNLSLGNNPGKAFLAGALGRRVWLRYCGIVAGESRFTRI